MSRTGVARALISAMLLIVPATLAGSVAGPAHALPADNGTLEPPTAGVTLAWPALGLTSGTVLGPNTSASFTVPVPTGLNAVRLRGLLHIPVDIDGGFLEIDDGDGKFLAAVDLPAPASAQVATPFDVDISAARRRASSVDLSFMVRPLNSAGSLCDPLMQVAISDLATVFAGAEAPVTTVASFFAPVLDQVTIYAPADADTAEQQAVLTLVSTLARVYRPQPLAISVATQQRGATPAPASQLTRAIVVERGPAGFSVQNSGGPSAYLRISGKGDELTTQLSLLVNELQSLAQAPAIRVDEAASADDLSGDTLTFSQLKMTGKTDVLRTGSMTVGVDRTALLGSGRVDSLKVHLLADYTPVPKNDAAAVVIRSNGIVVYRALLDSTGLLDATFDMDRQTFGQGVNLEFALTYTPQQVCGPLLAPITFQVDPRSTLTMHRGGPPLGGFTAFPSEFSPGFMVALDGSSPNQLAYASRVIAAIARLTNSQLNPHLVDVMTAADATTGVLIVAKSTAINQTSLNPPVSGDGAAVDVELPASLRANVTDGLGSIQAFADTPRNRSVVLVTTTAAWTLVDPLLNYIDGPDVSWTRLTGDVLAAGAAGTPTNLAIRNDGEKTFDPASVSVSGSGSSATPWAGIGIGAAVLVLAAIVAALVWRRRPNISA
ncbi:hypothetical protein BH09ACT7_BH09ACT7_33230 [soil metagenome]